MTIKIKTPDGIISRRATDRATIEVRQKFPMRIQKNKKAYTRKNKHKEENKSWD